MLAGEYYLPKFPIERWYPLTKKLDKSRRSSFPPWNQPSPLIRKPSIQSNKQPLGHWWITFGISSSVSLHWSTSVPHLKLLHPIYQVKSSSMARYCPPFRPQRQSLVGPNTTIHHLNISSDKCCRQKVVIVIITTFGWVFMGKRHNNIE